MRRCPNRRQASWWTSETRRYRLVAHLLANLVDVLGRNHWDALRGVAVDTNVAGTVDDALNLLVVGLGHYHERARFAIHVVRDTRLSGGKPGNKDFLILYRVETIGGLDENLSSVVDSLLGLHLYAANTTHGDGSRPPTAVSRLSVPNPGGGAGVKGVATQSGLGGNGRAPRARNSNNASMPMSSTITVAIPRRPLASLCKLRLDGLNRPSHKRRLPGGILSCSLSRFLLFIFSCVELLFTHF